MHTFRLFYFFLVFLLLAGSLQAAKIDVEARDLSIQDIRKYGGLVQSGALVSHPTGNALAAGIKIGDVIIAINEAKISGIYDLEEVLQTIRGMKFTVKVQRVSRKGLLKMTEHDIVIESAIDLQIKKSFTLNIEDDISVKTGLYRGENLLLWHVNRIWVYDRKTEKEKFVSLLKVYSIAEHKTYRYTVPEKVVYSKFLNDDGLLLYVSNIDDKSYIGIIDIETGAKRVQWQYEVKSLRKKTFDLKFKDINGDNISEVFLSVDHSITCLDGATGNNIWVRNDLETYFAHERKTDADNMADIFIDDFSRNGAYEVSVGPLLLNAATGEKQSYLSFDPAVLNGGVIECRQLIGDAIPDIICADGLYDGNSGEKVWQPLRSENYFLADLNSNGHAEIIYLLSDKKLHVHDIINHKESYSIKVDGTSDLAMKDFNKDGFIDLLVRNVNNVILYQTNIPVKNAHTKTDRGLGYAASLLDYGLKKDRFYVFGRELFQSGKFKSSVPLFMRSLAENPKRKEVVRYLATAFIKSNDIEGALGLLRHQQGNFVRGVLNDFASEIVSYLLEKNETWQAIHFLEMRKDEDPLLLARCYLAVGRPEVAIKLLTEMESKPTQAQLILGKAYVLTNKMIAARIAYKNYLKYFPTSSNGWDELAALEAHEQNWEEAIEAHNISLDLSPITGNIGLANFYLLESPHKDLKLSLKYSRTAHRLEPSNLTKIMLSESLVANSMYKEASHFLSQVTDPGPRFNQYEKLLQRCMYQNQAEAKYTEAEKLLLSPVFKKRNFKNAKEILNEIISRYPKSEVYPLAHFRLGEIFLDADHRDEQKAIYHFAQVEKADHYLSEKASNKMKEEPTQKSTNLLKIEQIKRPGAMIKIMGEKPTEPNKPKINVEVVQPNLKETLNRINNKRRDRKDNLKSVPFSLLNIHDNQAPVGNSENNKNNSNKMPSTNIDNKINLTPEPIILQEDL
jgi:tetratricopeptide (TPR) repeat protein